MIEPEQEQEQLPEFVVPQCDMCNGSEWLYLGLLGLKAHLRCQACGWQISVNVNLADDETSKSDQQCTTCGAVHPPCNLCGSVCECPTDEPGEPFKHCRACDGQLPA